MGDYKVKVSIDGLDELEEKVINIIISNTSCVSQ